MISIIVITIFLFILYNLFKINRKNFKYYQKKYPDLVKNGRVTCFSCGGKSIFLRKIGHTPLSIINAHTCRTCGTVLYYSKSK